MKFLIRTFIFARQKDFLRIVSTFSEIEMIFICASSHFNSNVIVRLRSVHKTSIGFATLLLKTSTDH